MIDRSWSATGSALIPSGKHISLSFWLSGFLSLSSVLLPVFILIPQPRYAPFSSPFPSLPLLSSPTGRTSSPPPNPTQPSTRPLTTTSNAPSPTKLNCKGGRIWASSGWGWRRFRRRSTRLGWGGSSSRGGGPGEWCRSWDGYAFFFFFLSILHIQRVLSENIPFFFRGERFGEERTHRGLDIDHAPPPSSAPPLLSLHIYLIASLLRSSHRQR
jgi:hypothetical protein